LSSEKNPDTGWLWGLLFVVLVCSDFRCYGDPPPFPEFVRGDFNGDEVVNVSDFDALCSFLNGGDGPDCEDAADVNDDGTIDSSDCSLRS
jgi:hypothetical protein